MRGWSKLKKTVVIAIVAFFGLGGIGALTNNQKSSTTPQTTVTAPPKVQSDTTQTQQTQTPIQTAPVSTPTPKVTTPTTVTTPEPAPTKPNCDPNYTGCVPNVYPADVDCAGGSGNGPYYASGPVRVIGTDRYGLDRDHDGTACE
jgi:hypothetical protein